MITPGRKSACRTCGGTGKVTTEQRNKDNTTKTVKATCPACNGTGQNTYRTKG